MEAELFDEESFFGAIARTGAKRFDNRAKDKDAEDLRLLEELLEEEEA